MLPLILVSNNEKQTEKYISQFIKDNKILLYSVFLIKPAKDELIIDQIREIKRQVSVATADIRLFILYLFDNSSSEVQNALLKTLEEKTENNQFILIAKNAEKIFSTIRSRSRLITIIKNTQIKDNEKINDLLNTVINEKDTSFLSSTLVTGTTKAKSLDLFDEFIIYFKKKLVNNERDKAVKIMKQIISAKKYLLNNNLNSQLTLDNLLIFIWKTYSIK